jgi:hypothetical protein
MKRKIQQGDTICCSVSSPRVSFDVVSDGLPLLVGHDALIEDDRQWLIFCHELPKWVSAGR